MTEPASFRWPSARWVVAIAVGGASALFHLAGAHPGFAGSEDAPLVIGQGLLYAAPLFLGILAGIAEPTTPARVALGLVFVTMLTAAPLMFQDIICLIFIVPVNVVIAPIAAALTASIVRWRRRRRGVGIETLLLVIPFAGATADRIAPPDLPPAVELVDSVTVDLPREAVWSSLDRLHLPFHHEPPWLLRELLPIPREVVGGGSHIGAERRVVFSNGVIIARVVRSTAPERFTFRTEVEAAEVGFFDHFVVLDDSEFVLERRGARRTRITHRTRYRPLAFPRWYFEPGERLLGRMVQAYMLEAYAAALLEPDGAGSTLALTPVAAR